MFRKYLDFFYSFPGFFSTDGKDHMTCPVFMGRVDSLEKALMLGEIGGRRRRGRQRMRWLDGITDSMVAHSLQMNLRDSFMDW